MYRCSEFNQFILSQVSVKSGSPKTNGCVWLFQEIGVPQTIGFPIENDNELESLNDSLRSSQLEKETPDHLIHVRFHPRDILYLYIYIILSHYILLYSTVSHYIELYSIVYYIPTLLVIPPWDVGTKWLVLYPLNIPLITFLAKIIESRSSS